MQCRGGFKTRPFNIQLMGAIPLLTIVGVPNTGKSTLFNRILGKRKALVHSMPRMTRDIFRQKVKINDQWVDLQDSGGFFMDKEIITAEINKKIFKAAEKSDLIIFLFDGKRELLGYEKDLYLQIKKLHKHIVPVLNKVDNLDQFIPPLSYFELKADYIYVSAEHNLGVEVLLDQITRLLQNSTPAIPDLTQAPRISIIGKPNVGKSSIINKIVNDELVIVSPLPGTTRDSIDLEVRRNRQMFILVDNAGIRKLQKVKEDTESAAVIRAEKEMRQSDIIIFVIDISKRIDQNDMLIAQKIVKAAKPVIIAGKRQTCLPPTQAAISFSPRSITGSMPFILPLLSQFPPKPAKIFFKCWTWPKASWLSWIKKFNSHHSTNW